MSKRGSRAAANKAASTPRSPRGGKVIFEPVSASADALVRGSVGGGHLKVLEPVPGEAAKDPERWAEDHLKQLVPLAAKEKEWQLKFGSDERRDKVATELLAMRGIQAKKDNAAPVQPAIVLVGAGPNPWAQQVVDGKVVTRELPRVGVAPAVEVSDEEEPA